MEQHPIPRNISSFEFHLIGDMTVKQFGYLVIGGLTAFVMYKILPLPAILKYPVAGLFLFAGFAFAFMPIQERPLDKWLIAFIKSINSPTQYVWIKNEEPPEILTRSFSYASRNTSKQHKEAHIDANQKLKAYLLSSQTQPHHTLNLKEKNYIEQTLKLFQTTGNVPTPPVVQTIQKTDLSFAQAPVLNQNVQPPFQKIEFAKPLQKHSENSSEVKISKLATADITKPQLIHNSDFQNNINSDDLNKELKKIALEKDALQKELDRLKKELEASSKPDIIKPELEVERPKPTIKTVTPKNAVEEIGIPKLPQTPNMVMGVVKNSQNQLLPNIILTIKDKKKDPCRALKTNRLGQFETATPLKNGTYFIEAEDPLKRYIFDIAEIILEGKVFLPIEINAKGEKEIRREQLTKELFGSATTL